MKLLTVTVPCYNSQDYMEKCIDSLLVGGDRVEILVIDDGSKDRTGAIADAYAEKYPGIVRVIHQENGGHGEGINQGLRHATGKYFKVVDSDDCMSADFPAFLEQLACNDVDLFVTNYYYTHTDGIGDRSIHYKHVLPVGKVFNWQETKRFGIHQLLTLHSCTFRTELMRKWGTELPKHVFYEDNLMVYLTLPFVKTMYYSNMDLYRYTIGREGQSVQADISMRRYTHQLLVAERCFTSCRLDGIDNRKLKQYLKHELFMMFGIGIMFTRSNRSAEADAKLEQMWDACKAFDPKWGNYFRNRTVLRFVCIPGKFGQNFAIFIYRLANKVVRFN